MFRSLRIKNFRGFQDTKLEPLARINLISGANNAGKTAVLEAIFLHLGANNPQLALNINVLRGIQQFAANPRDMFGWLFFERHMDKTIEIQAIDDQDKSRLLQIRLVAPQETRVIRGKGNKRTLQDIESSITTSLGQRELRFEYEDPSGRKHTSHISTVTASDRAELKVRNANIVQPSTGVLITTHTRFPGVDAERFSELERIGREGEVLSVLQSLDHRLRRLSVLVTGGEPTINADIGIGQLIPVPLMGEGFGRLLEIVLAIANVPNGTILIDEIENGLHYSVLPDVWRAISLAAQRANVQIFATTHSWECIQAAHQAFEAGGVYDFRLHRLERIGQAVEAVTYDQEMLAVALEAGLETR